MIIFGICANLTTGCVSKSGGGIFSFGVTASSLSMCTLSKKTFGKEGKVNPMSHYENRCLVCLAKIEPTFFCGRDHLVSAVQRQGTRKKDGSTPTTNVS